ncbi:hypothetical protein [Mitsuaria sp. GD03876]|uniref:hypothetical protein n=1 Tax=Mitsuaria sp. GD03876 TaxID=2975399 RepID=UPI002446E9F8|nr:hypothetical protein [Mitsuaria sp. GD03876]MDH0867751.1 hypothetical protein [Mitsuaria sp. GD03876]
MLEDRYEKTEAGRAEIKSRALVQARVARNLLLVIDAGKTGGEWLGLVQGAVPADLELLLQHQLVKVTAGAPLSRPMAGAPASVPMASSSGPSSRMSGASASKPAPSRLAGAPTSSLDYSQLYAALSTFAKQQGLLKGYKLALEVEQCADMAALQTLALDIVDRVRASKGDAAAHELRATLGFN